jgi:histidinol dehydrogenase
MTSRSAHRSFFAREQGASELGKTASVLARGESLTGHARSAEYRIIADKKGQ